MLSQLVHCPPRWGWICTCVQHTETTFKTRAGHSFILLHYCLINICYICRQAIGLKPLSYNFRIKSSAVLLSVIFVHLSSVLRFETPLTTDFESNCLRLADLYFTTFTVNPKVRNRFLITIVFIFLQNCRLFFYGLVF